jgi:peptidoglycan hydrolase-like protein with peptidoglycan-binding domain
MTKLDTIAEADDARAQYDKFKADDAAKEARAAAIKLVKSRIVSKWNVPSGMTVIGKEDGKIYWVGAQSGGGEGHIDGTQSGRTMSMDMYNKGTNFVDAEFKNALNTLGIKVVPVAQKTLFGSTEVAAVSLQQLADLDKPVAPTPAPTPNKPADKPADPGQDPTDANMKELDKLRDQLLATLKGQAPMPSPVTPVTPVTPVKDKEKTLGQKVGVGAGIAAGALAGQQMAKRAGFKGVGQGLAGLAGGAVGGLGVNAFQKEGVEYNSSIAQTLTESFGYEFEDTELDEYSMSQFSKDAGDFGRGAWNGVTLGTGDNITAGVKSAFGSGSYKDELAKQAAASKEAETRSPWLYGAGNVAGALAVPIPGGAVGALAAKGARAVGAGAGVATGAKIAGVVGANLAAQKAVDVVKQKSDLNTFVGTGGDKRIGALQQAIGLVGAQIDGKMGPNTAKSIMAYQKAQGLPVTGKADPATMAKAGIAESRATTVAEDIKSIQQKLAMIESGQWSLEEDTVYRVWLRPDNTVIDDNGVLITDDELLENIQWDPAFLAEFDYGAKYFGKGVDAIKGAAGKLFGRGEQKAAQVATKPPAATTNTVYTRRANNPNAAKADLPGAPTVTKDLTGAAITPGTLSATGSIGAARAQAAADNAVDAGRAASKELGGTMNAMVKGSDDAAGVVGKTADDAAGVVGKTADDAAGVVGKELSAAEKAAASAEAQAAKQSGRLSGWVKANPKKALALGLGGAAAIGAGTMAALSGDEAPAGGEEGGSSGSTTTGTDTPASGGSGQGSMPTAPSELTPEQKEIIAKMQKIIQGVGATEDEGLLGHIAPANAAIQKVTQSVASAKPATSGQAASPAGTTSTPSQTITVPKVPAGTTIDNKGQVKESDDELARWLKIARS